MERGRHAVEKVVVNRIMDLSQGGELLVSLVRIGSESTVLACVVMFDDSLLQFKSNSDVLFPDWWTRSR